MGQAIAEILRQRIAGLGIVGKSAGMVRTVSRSIGGKEKTFPVACSVVDPLQCSESEALDLVPDSRQTSIVYFEDLGTTKIQHKAEHLIGKQYQDRLRMVGWINLAKIGDLCSSGDHFLRMLLEAIEVKPYDVAPFRQIKHSVTGTQPKTKAIFSKYTYDDTNRQYLNWPYDYFAVDITTTYILPPGCEEPLIPVPQDCEGVGGGPIISGPSQPCPVVRVCGTPEVGQTLVWDGSQWVPGAGGGGSSVWGGITGDIANQTDLQAALDNKVSCTVPVLLELDPLGIKITIGSEVIILPGLT